MGARGRGLYDRKIHKSLRCALREIHICLVSTIVCSLSYSITHLNKNSFKIGKINKVIQLIRYTNRKKNVQSILVEL